MKIHTKLTNKKIPANAVITQDKKSYAFLFAMNGKWYFNSTNDDGSKDFFDKLLYSIKKQIELIKKADEWQKENSSDRDGLEPERLPEGQQ